MVVVAILDNMARRPVMKIGPEDRVSQQAALKVFAGTDESLFPGAKKLIIRNVSTVRRVVSVDPQAKRERDSDADDRAAKKTRYVSASLQDEVAAQKELEAAAKTAMESEPQPGPEPDAAGIVRYFAQQRAVGRQMTAWDSMGNNKDDAIEL